MLEVQKYTREKFLLDSISGSTNIRLTNELAAEVQGLLHNLILQAVNQIVDELNTSGHNLRYCQPPIPGDIVLRDNSEEGAVYSCDLRLGIDTIISIGFRDTRDHWEKPT